MTSRYATFLTCTEISHIHVLLLVGILIIKHAKNYYTEGKVHGAFSTTDRTLVNGYAQKHRKERELNITFKLLNQCEE
jgi:hypothetical protein